ncbi:MAG: DUF362 domain-containing protein [Candidatus Hodarchaeota archaeon]
MVKKSVDELGGIRNFVKPSEKVLVWVSLAFSFPPPAITDPRVTQAVARLILEEAKPKEVVVGAEASAVTHRYRGTSTRESFIASRTAEHCEEIGVKWIPADEYGYNTVRFQDGIVARKFRISKLLSDYDVLINVPRAGQWGFATLETSAGVKLMAMGLLDDEHKLMWHRNDLAQKICDVFGYIKSTGKNRLTVTDLLLKADLRVVGGGIEELDLILASTDPVASDSIAGWIVGIDIMQWHTESHLRLCNFYKYGCGDYTQIKTIGNISLEEAKKLATPAKHTSIFIDGVFPGVHVLPGGVCNQCYQWCRPMLEFLYVEGSLDKIKEKYGGMTIIIGTKPDLPDEPEDVNGLPVLFGDCAIEAMMHEHGWYRALDAMGQDAAGRATKLAESGKSIVLIPGCMPCNARGLMRNFLERDGLLE